MEARWWRWRRRDGWQRRVEGKMLNSCQQFKYSADTANIISADWFSAYVSSFFAEWIQWFFMFFIMLLLRTHISCFYFLQTFSSCHRCAAFDHSDHFTCTWLDCRRRVKWWWPRDLLIHEFISVRSEIWRNMMFSLVQP